VRILYGKKLPLRLLTWAAALAGAWLAVRWLVPWLLPFLLALAAARALEPVVQRCRDVLRWKRRFTAAVLTLALVAAAAALLTALILGLGRPVYELLPRLPRYLERLPALYDTVQERLDRFCRACPEGLRSWADRLVAQLSEQLAARSSALSRRVVETAARTAAALPRILLFCATTVLAIYFTINDYQSLKELYCRALSPSARRTLHGVGDRLGRTLGAWLRAQAILVSLTFGQLLLGFLLLRQPYALLLSALIALIDALPVLGTGTVLLPWAVLCLLSGAVPRGVALLALYAVIALVRSAAEPRIMAAQGGLPPLAALAALYVGFCALGVAGMILCPVLLLFLKELWDGGYLRLPR
jgi:sporulation integral membrane protein YtvI